MRTYNEVDIRFYPDETEGDFAVDETGDFALTSAFESARQDVINRVRTQKGDWRSHQNLGADLELLEGEPNTRQTGQRGELMIREALTYDHRFSSEDIMIRGVPTAIDHIDYYIGVDTQSDKKVIVQAPVNL